MADNFARLFVFFRDVKLKSGRLYGKNLSVKRYTIVLTVLAYIAGENCDECTELCALL